MFRSGLVARSPVPRGMQWTAAPPAPPAQASEGLRRATLRLCETQPGSDAPSPGHQRQMMAAAERAGGFAGRGREPAAATTGDRVSTVGFRALLADMRAKGWHPLKVRTRGGHRVGGFRGARGGAGGMASGATLWAHLVLFARKKSGLG